MTAQKQLRRNQGFTLIELLVVIGILAVLLAITLIAINPARQFSQANDTKRRSDINAILNAIHQYSVDNSGVAPAEVSTTAQEISDGGADICADLIPEYIAALPSDPLTGGGANIESTECGGAYATGYEVSRSATDNRITVSAPDAEIETDMQVTR